MPGVQGTPQGVRILSLDAKDIYLSNHYKEPSPIGYNIRNKDGDISVKRFVNVLDYSLDLIKLREVYQRVYRKRDFGFMSGRYEYTTRIINVTFKYSVKMYNEIRGGLYIKNGYRMEDVVLDDCVCIKDNELVAIKVGEDVHSPIGKDLLGKYFYFTDGKYQAKRNIKNVFGVGDLREQLYEDGFYCNGIHYVRFKRSSGSSRVGKCLFIDEKLYPAMAKWQACGIKIKEGQDIDLAAYEAYIALTLSSIIDTIEINPENILVIDDFESVFKDRVIAVREDEKFNLTAAPEEIEVSNSIWDGQSLMDISLFGKYSQYGMLLLRNRFFKSCCFNCNLEWFFADNGITDVSQLNGFTLAKRVEDVKLITTPSSIKYLKFGKLGDWLQQIDPIFGVVKHEKKTHFFDGRMVQSHYQLLNTLQLDYDEVKELVQPSLDYVDLLNHDPAVLRHHIKYPAEEEFRMPMTALESKNDIVYKLLGLNDDFAKTALYSAFRKDLTTSFVNNMRRGHILINGNYETLLGNPMEMLYQAIGKFDGTSDLGIGHVHTKRFEYGKTLLGCRSPHINPGNILLTENVKGGEIDSYFNLTPEILCVNAIEENIQQRLNGCDYDSDSIIVSDNQILINAAKRNYDMFPVPTNLVSSKKTKRQYTKHQQADLDIKTSVNKIGEIVNLSQEINTMMWDAINRGAAIEDVYDLYLDSSKLCIMSGLEIDSAKKEFTVSNTKELKKLKKKYERRDKKDGRMIKPGFFGFVAKTKGYYNPQKKKYQTHHTTMDYLQQVIRRGYKNNSNVKALPFSSIIDSSKFDIERVRYEQVNLVLDAVRAMRANQQRLWMYYKQDMLAQDGEADAGIVNTDVYQMTTDMVFDQYQDCVDYIDSMRFSYSTMCWLLYSIESDGCSDIRRVLFNILFGAPNKNFYRAIRDSAKPIMTIVPDENGDINIYGERYKHVMLEQ